MKKTLVTLAAAFLLGGCGTLTGGEIKLAQTVLDGEVQTAEFVICRAIPIGTWQRNYGVSAERAEGWAKLCNPPTTTPAVPALPAAVVPAKPVGVP